jgi:serine/threonine protein kinase/formylglycine-generating enzyme required for sulfatase activity
MSPDFHREYLVRLPLPLAQLYSRARNAKNARGRHDNIFYLFEALTKLAAAPAILAYVQEVRQGAPRAPALDRLLAQLALPSLGQWTAMVRELARWFGNRPDAASHPLGHLWEQLRRPRRDLPGVLALYRRIKNGADGAPAAEQSCSLAQLFESLVQYRNGVFGHGAGRFDSFYEQEMGPLLFPAANEVLAEGTFDLLGPRGSRLVYLSEVRTVDEGRVEVGLRELVGLQGERLAPLVLAPDQAGGVLPNRVAVLWPGRPVPLALDPLLAYREGELADELLFLNRDRDGRQVEYLSYTTGRTERDRNTAPALAALLSLVANRKVDEADLGALAEQSRAEAPPAEGMPPPAPPTSRQLGDYEILGEIGRGGMGVVYLARQLSLGRLVALKTLPAETAGDEVALARFRREVRHLARCEHANIVKVLTSGTLPDGQLYYTMEYVPGSNLELVWRELSGSHRAGEASTLGGTTWTRAVLSATRKQREQTGKGQVGPIEPEPLPELPSAPDDPGGYVRHIARLVRDAALALQAVHEQGIVHRDVKPANLMLTPDGTRVVLMDFGLAKGQSLTLAASRAGGFLGTLRYAAPEQLAAATLKVGPEADVRGLGVTLWELLTRRRLFEEADDERQLASLIYDRDVPPLRSVDPSLDRDLEAIVARATERSVSDRIATARELADYLTLYLEGKPLPIRPPTTRELLKRWVLRHKALVGSVAAAAVVVLATVVTAFALITAALADSQAALKKQRQAESERALGQVDALLEADPEAIPGLVNGLELNRPEVVARLRDPPGADSTKKRLRAALALLRIDRDKLSDLQQELFETDDVKEVRAICKLLPPDEPGLRERLWEAAQDPAAKGEHRLRAAAALAALAPEDPRWTRLGRQIVYPFLSANLRDLGEWIGALQPVRDALLDPLAVEFRQSDQPEQRRAAADILAKYSADRPETIADLATRADPRQYEILLPVLRKHPDRAVAWLGQELDRLAEPLAPEWSDPPLDPSSPPPDPALVREFERGHGLLTDRFALCQTMPLDQFLAAVEGLRRYGYRPTCFRPYAVGNVVQVAAVWVRDWRDWHLAHSATAEEIAKQGAQWRAKGYWPRDVAGYVAESGGKAVEQYAALWADPEPGVAESWLYIGTAGSDVGAIVRELQEAGLIPRTQLLFRVKGGQRYGGVWWRPDQMPDLRWGYAGDEEAAYESHLSPSLWQADVRVGTAQPPTAPRPGYEDQLTQVQESLRRAPDAPQLRGARGYLYFCLGQDEPALADLDYALAKAPQATLVYFWRALARARLGRAADARQDMAAYQKASNHPGDNLVLDVAVPAFLGEDAAAVKRLETDLAVRGEDPYWLYHAACAYGAVAQAVAAKQPDQSRAYADRAVALLRRVAGAGFIGDSAFKYRPLPTVWALDALWDRPGFQELLGQGHLDQQYSAVWYGSYVIESAESHGLDPEQHLGRCRQLAGDRWRPASVSVAWLGDGRPLVTASVWHRPVVPDAAQEDRARRQAQVAVALLGFGEGERVWPLLRHREDPRVRSHLVHRLAPLKSDPQALIDRLKDEPDVSARRALLLSLGEFPDDRPPAQARAALLPDLLATYRDHADPGLHAAADWLLRRWGQADQLRAIDRRLRRPDPDGGRGWYVNQEGQTLVVLRDPGEFWMGSTAGEPDRSIKSDTPLHRERIPRSFAIAAREVTVPEFERFVRDRPEVDHGYTTADSPDPEGAAIDVTWFQAAQYCNWLSQREGLPEREWCYLPNALGRYVEGMALAPDHLQRTGYRLPTMAEWEYASRAGTRTGRFYGTAKELLGKYAFYAANSDDHAWAVGQLKPNDFGLFDVYGNVCEWCQDYRTVSERGSHGQPHVDWVLGGYRIFVAGRRETRGSSFLDPAARLRSAYEGSEAVTHLSRDMGFRVARTIRPK